MSSQEVEILMRVLLACLMIAWTIAGYGQLTTHPEALAGRWETSDGRGGNVGMNITLLTALPI